jgi:hypothetical protein
MTPVSTGPHARIRTVLLAGVLALFGCSSATQSSATDAAAASPARFSLPPVHGRFSYQIGGPYTPASGVRIVDRDHLEPAAKGVYGICYLNAFQSQTDAIGWWTQHHPELLLRQPSGALVIDKDWNEPLFDISTAAKRTALLSVVGGWIDGCAASGYRAVEADNLDSYTRSKDVLNVEDALAFGALLAARAHHDQLAIAQKNGSDFTKQAHRAGFDFAITEECQVFSECDAYTAVYGRRVIEIEYTDNPMMSFTIACKLRGRTISVVLRDRAVAPAGLPQHVERWCSG